MLIYQQKLKSLLEDATLVCDTYGFLVSVSYEQSSRSCKAFMQNQFINIVTYRPIVKRYRLTSETHVAAKFWVVLWTAHGGEEPRKIRGK